MIYNLIDFFPDTLTACVRFIIGHVLLSDSVDKQRRASVCSNSTHPIDPVPEKKSGSAYRMRTGLAATSLVMLKSCGFLWQSLGAAEGQMSQGRKKNERMKEGQVVRHIERPGLEKGRNVDDIKPKKWK